MQLPSSWLPAALLIKWPYFILPGPVCRDQEAPSWEETRCSSPSNQSDTKLKSRPVLLFYIPSSSHSNSLFVASVTFALLGRKWYKANWRNKIAKEKKQPIAWFMRYNAVNSFTNLVIQPNYEAIRRGWGKVQLHPPPAHPTVLHRGKPFPCQKQKENKSRKCTV